MSDFYNLEVAKPNEPESNTAKCPNLDCGG